MHFKAKTPRIASKKRLFKVLLFSIFFTLCSVNAFAITSWQVISGNWDVPENWNSGIPTSQDDAIVANDGTAIIGANVSAEAQALFVGSQDKLGTVSISNGGVLRYFGLEVGAPDNPGTSTVLLDGAQSKIIVDGYSAIGSIGVGSLSASNGAEISSGLGLLGTFTQIGFNGGFGNLSLSSGAALSTGFVEFDSVGTLSFNGGILKQSFGDTADFIRKSPNATTYNLIINGDGATIDSNGFDIGTELAFSGSGGLTKEGSGTFTLRGDNTYEGDTTILGGTLQLGNGGSTGSVLGPISIASLGKLVFNHSNTLTYGGVISGTGPLSQAGGTTILTGASTSYLGDATIDAGTLQLGDPGHLTAALGGNVIVTMNGTLSGYGTIDKNLTSNGGIVSPGASIGTLTVNGNYVQSSSGTYVVQVDQSGNSDLLQIGGTATLDGTVGISAINNGFLRNYPYTILTAAGGVSGTFSNTNIDGIFNQGFLQGVVSYLPTGSPTIVQFEVDYNPVLFEEAAITPNQKAVADYILLTGGTPGVQALISTLTTDAEFQAAMDQISGATYANQTMAIAHVGSGFERELANRFMAFPSASDPRCVCPNGQLKYQNRNQAPGGWVSVYGGQDDIHSGQVSGLITNSEGIALGYEWPVNCQTKLGVGAGYTHFKGHATDRESASDNGNLLQVGLYGRYEKCGWLLGAAIDAGRTTDLSAERQVQGAMALFSPKSHYRANLLSEQVVASYDLLGSKRCWKLRPFVGFINQQVNSDGFTEEGNSGFELNVRSNDYHSARSQLGVLWEAPITQSVRPFASVDWEHEFADRNGSFDASLVGLTTPPTFHIVGQEIGRDSAGVKAGLNLVRQGRFNLAVLYQGQFASGWQQNGAALEAGFRFD